MIAPPHNRQTRAAEIALEAVCRLVGVELSEVLGGSRSRSVVRARWLWSVVCRERTDCSYPELARVLCREHHSTIVTADQRGRALIALDPGFAALYRRALEIPCLATPDLPAERGCIDAAGRHHPTAVAGAAAGDFLREVAAIDFGDDSRASREWPARPAGPDSHAGFTQPHAWAMGKGRRTRPCPT